jgi:hypothetical protein
VPTHLDRPDEVAGQKLDDTAEVPGARKAASPNVDRQLLDDAPRLAEHPIHDRPVVDVTTVEADHVLTCTAAEIETISQIAIDVLTPTVTDRRCLQGSEGLVARMSKLNPAPLAKGLDGQFNHIVGTPEERRGKGYLSWWISSEHGGFTLTLYRDPPDLLLSHEGFKHHTRRGNLPGRSLSQDHSAMLRHVRLRIPKSNVEHLDPRPMSERAIQR